MRLKCSAVAAAQSCLRLAAAPERRAQEPAVRVQTAREPGGLAAAEGLAAPAVPAAHAEEREPRAMGQMAAAADSSEAAAAPQRVAPAVQGVQGVQGVQVAPPWIHVAPAEAAAPSFQQAPLAWRAEQRAVARACPGATALGGVAGLLPQQAAAAAARAHGHVALEALARALALADVGHSLR